MSIRLEALIEHWPDGSVLYVGSLPGFVVRGHDSAELQRRVSDALQAHLGWLVAHDLIEDPAGEVDLAVVEQARSVSATVGPLFAADLPAPSEGEIETALAIGRAAVSDLIDLADAASAGDGFDPTAPLRATAALDRWYAERLGLHGSPPAGADPIDDLVDAAGTFEDAVDAFLGSDHPALFTVDGEEWTLAKVLRRRTGQLVERLPEPPPRRPEPGS